MTKLQLLIELEYDEEVIYGDDPTAIHWFYNEVLLNTSIDEPLILHSNDIGDNIGVVKVLKILSQE